MFAKNVLVRAFRSAQTRGGRSTRERTPEGAWICADGRVAFAVGVAGITTTDAVSEARARLSTVLDALGARPCSSATSTTCAPEQSSTSPASIEAFGSSSVGGGANMIAPRASQSGALELCANATRGATSHTKAAASSDTAIRKKTFKRVEFGPDAPRCAMFLGHACGRRALPPDLWG